MCGIACRRYSALVAGGLPIMELVFRSFAHSRAIRRIAKEMPDFIIGAGNILNKDQLVRAIDSSARFAFSPGTEPEMIKEASKRRIVFAPGVCTASNIQTAMLSGITEFQFFPAEQSGGAEVLKAICEPFHHLGIEFFAKGGITLENMKSYLVRKEVRTPPIRILKRSVIQRPRNGLACRIRRKCRVKRCNACSEGNRKRPAAAFFLLPSAGCGKNRNPAQQCKKQFP